MKKQPVYIAAALALVAAGIYVWQKRKALKKPVKALPQKENERHHLTNAFSKAKAVALGN